MYSIVYERPALKALKKMQPAKRAQIRAKLESIAADPYALNNNVTALQGRDGYRLRVGDWRVIYELRDNMLTLVTIDIAPRGGVYKH